jgi:cytidine deaminase
MMNYIYSNNHAKNFVILLLYFIIALQYLLVILNSICPINPIYRDKFMATKTETKQKKYQPAVKDAEKIQRMSKIAIEMMNKAYAPYSKYHVGVCIEAEDGNLFGGCNVENASYGMTLCAECSAVSALIGSGRKRIKSLLVMGSGEELCTPCGRCRQLIREFAVPDTPIYLCNNKGELKETVTLEQLLPRSFGPGHLNK